MIAANYARRGKHLGVYVNRSTKARERTLARKIVKEAGQFAIPRRADVFDRRYRLHEMPAVSADRSHGS
jgi:hypothetical protein